jgi:hypothetical protein
VIDPRHPVASFLEREMLPSGTCGRVLTVILSNRECPYRCAFCGLWQDTLDASSAPGDVAVQVERAIDEQGPCEAIKLYNAGSFFDEQAIAPRDRDRMAELCSGFDTVIVESRPELIDQRAADFARRVRHLHVAIGLEVADDQILALMNKRMTLASIARAAHVMKDRGITWRAFIMIQPPLIDPRQAMQKARDSVRFAADHGANTVSLIRSYRTPGAMEELQEQGFWQPPDLWPVYEAARWSLENFDGITLVDRWSLDQEPRCPDCRTEMDRAFETSNTRQELTRVSCRCRSAWEQRSADPTITIKGPDAYRAWLRVRMADPAP